MSDAAASFNIIILVRTTVETKLRTPGGWFATLAACKPLITFVPGGDFTFLFRYRNPGGTSTLPFTETTHAKFKGPLDSE
jgi:hypothetical protein